MAKSLSAATGALVTTLLLTACSASAHGKSHTWAAGCARAEAGVRSAALQVGPYVGVTTTHDVIAANNKLLTRGPEIVAARKAFEKATFSGPRTSIKVVPFPQPVARTMHQVSADMSAFERASNEYYLDYAKAPAIGEAAQKMMRDIAAVRATCSQKH